MAVIELVNITAYFMVLATVFKVSVFHIVLHKKTQNRNRNSNIHTGIQKFQKPVDSQSLDTIVSGTYIQLKHGIRLSQNDGIL